MSKFNGLMTDLETFSSASNAAITAIGAVWFDINTGELGDTFYINVDAADCAKHGLDVDAGTVYWWLSQSKEAQNALLDEKVGLKRALKMFSDWVSSSDNDTKNLEMWSHSTFDAVVLSSASRACGVRLPWRYNQTRDIRTLNALTPPELNSTIWSGLGRDGTHHNALDDAIFQTRYVTAQYNAITKGEIPEEVKKTIQFNG